ncbi:hypothetical protein EV651_10169 [Kribbella sp. VKM Ac-2571]|nr:hypothetical protein EV651_10169 [Kribbella sp. VKM Ac-2571]
MQEWIRRLARTRMLARSRRMPRATTLWMVGLRTVPAQLRMVLGRPTRL